MILHIPSHPFHLTLSYFVYISSPYIAITLECASNVLFRSSACCVTCTYVRVLNKDYQIKTSQPITQNLEVNRFIWNVYRFGSRLRTGKFWPVMSHLNIFTVLMYSSVCDRTGCFVRNWCGSMQQISTSGQHGVVAMKVRQSWSWVSGCTTNIAPAALQSASGGQLPCGGQPPLSRWVAQRWAAPAGL